MAIFKSKKNKDELRKLAEDNGLEKLEDADLEDVAGGYVMDVASTWVVVDDNTGQLVGNVFPNKSDAQQCASKNGLSPSEIDYQDWFAWFHGNGPKPEPK